MASNYISTEKLLYYHAGLKNLFATKTEISDLEDVVDGKVDPATTLAGYGITDAYTKTEVDTALNGKVSTESGKGLSTNDYTTTEKNKLAGIAAGAEVNQNAFGNVKVGTSTIAADSKTDTLTLEAGSNVTLTPDTSGDKVTIAATDTTYGEASTSAAGLMSTAMVTKLNGIDTGAEVNQNAFSNITIGSTTIQADAKTDTLTLIAGDNVTLTPDASNDQITIAATDTTYSTATTSSAGLMSTTMVSKLSGIAEGAEVNVQSDWSVTNSSSDAYIKNKPTTISGYGITDAYTKTQTDSAIATAIAGVTQISFEIVQTLPSTGTNGTIYLVSNSGTAPNTYDEYIYVNNAWEKIGSTAVDLSGYWAKADLVEATNAQIDTILAS